MDLGAYAQIETLDKIAKENGIDVPRLWGYRLMKDEEPLSKQEIDEMKKDYAISVCEDCAEKLFDIKSNKTMVNEFIEMHKNR